ncbi:MAG: hypothetical protein HQM09_04430 [Candidatus Riflebacteria bacterium]|nr:hypothetical protein [Candidatus Riflebacteria bacterium]
MQCKPFAGGELNDLAYIGSRVDIWLFLEYKINVTRKNLESEVGMKITRKSMLFVIIVGLLFVWSPLFAADNGLLKIQFQNISNYLSDFQNKINDNINNSITKAAASSIINNALSATQNLVLDPKFDPLRLELAARLSSMKFRVLQLDLSFMQDIPDMLLAYDNLRKAVLGE